MSKKQVHFELEGNYRFCGNGQGIPGLPHEVSARQATELGLLEVLQAAIANGNYKPVSPSTTHVVEAAEGGSQPPRHEGE